MTANSFVLRRPKFGAYKYVKLYSAIFNNLFYYLDSAFFYSCYLYLLTLNSLRKDQGTFHYMLYLHSYTSGTVPGVLACGDILYRIITIKVLHIENTQMKPDRNCVLGI